MNQSLVSVGLSAAFVPCFFGVCLFLASDRWREIRDRHRATR